MSVQSIESGHLRTTSSLLGQRLVTNHWVRGRGCGCGLDGASWGLNFYFIFTYCFDGSTFKEDIKSNSFKEVQYRKDKRTCLV